jgi:peptide-methionine (S)-S-oxide reductase
MEFNGGIEVFREMCRYFFQIHDPTTLNRQGNDRGTQYASVIYAQDAEYFEVAVSTKDEVQKLVNAKKITSYQSVRVSTAVHLRTIFYRAKEEHQLYLDRHPDGYCNHRVRFNEWPSIDK